MSTIKTALSAATILAATTFGAAADPVLEPTTQKFIDGLAGAKPIYTLSPSDARDVLAGAQKGDVKKLAAKEENLTIKAGPTGSIKLRVVRPEGAKGKLPVVMYFHGGGWVLGDAETHVACATPSTCSDRTLPRRIFETASMPSRNRLPMGGYAGRSRTTTSTVI